MTTEDLNITTVHVSAWHGCTISNIMLDVYPYQFILDQSSAIHHIWTTDSATHEDFLHGKGSFTVNSPVVWSIS